MVPASQRLAHLIPTLCLPGGVPTPETRGRSNCAHSAGRLPVLCPSVFLSTERGSSFLIQITDELIHASHIWITTCLPSCPGTRTIPFHLNYVDSSYENISPTLLSPPLPSAPDTHPPPVHAPYHSGTESLHVLSCLPGEHVLGHMVTGMFFLTFPVLNSPLQAIMSWLEASRVTGFILMVSTLENTKLPMRCVRGHG